MRHLLGLGALALSAAAFSPAPALAEDKAPEAIGEVTSTLRDPQVQSQMAGVVAALSEALLDLDLTPLAEAAGQMAGEPVADLKGARTLREIAPEAEALPETIEREMPQMLGRMADMGDAMQALAPMLRDMAEAMEGAVERSSRQATDFVP